MMRLQNSMKAGLKSKFAAWYVYSCYYSATSRDSIAMYGFINMASGTETSYLCSFGLRVHKSQGFQENVGVC